MRTPRNEVLIAHRLLGGDRAAVAAGQPHPASASNCWPRRSIRAALTLLGFELSRIYLVVWTIYGLLAGLAGVLLASFFGVSSANAGALTASAFTIVILGGLGSVPGSLIAAYVVGYAETITAYLHRARPCGRFRRC